ncbi:MAG: hypothetical protein V3V67_15135, partial [Myxococcota bacterium]
MTSGLGGDYFFEILIYRGTPEEHVAYIERRRRLWVGGSWESVDPSDCFYKAHATRFELDQAYPPAFNDVVGAIGLYVFGHQVRGELHFTAAKQIRRGIRHRIVDLGKLFESSEFGRESNTEIYESVLTELESVSREAPL